MADGSINLDLDDWLAERLRSGAVEARMSEKEFVRFVLEQHLTSRDAFDWEEETPGEAGEERLVPLEDALSDVRRLVQQRLGGE
jgi:hypothetical protein